TSLPTSVYVADVAPCTALQRAPLASQRYHWNAYFIGPDPFHVPVSAARRRPTAVVPATLGLVVAIGPRPGPAAEACAAASARSATTTARAARLLCIQPEFDMRCLLLSTTCR